MADEVVGSPGGASPAPSSPAPAAPSSAPSSSAPATPAGGSDIAAETGVSSAPLEGESSVQTITRVAQEAAKKATDEPKPPADPAPPELAAPAADPAAPAPPADGAAPTEDEDEEPFTIDDAPEPTLPTRELSKRIASAPELKAALEKYPELKDAMYSASRIAAKAKPVLDLVPDKETAETLVQQSTEFSELSGLFLDATDVDKTKQFLGRLQAYDTLRDENGQPLKDEQGRPKSSGAVGRFLDFTLDTAMQYWGAIANDPKNPNHELAAAVDALQAARGRGTRPAEEEDLPEHVKRAQADVKSREEVLRRQETEAAAAKEATFETGIQTGIESSLDKDVKTYLDQCDLGGQDPKLVADAIKATVYGTLRDSARFRAERDRLMLSPQNDKTQRDRVALAMRWAKPLLKNAARTELKKAGARLKGQQDAVREKTAAGQAESRSEPKSGGQPPSPQVPTSTEDLMTMATNEWKAANGGREPSSADIMQQFIVTKQRLGIR